MKNKNNGNNKKEIQREVVVESRDLWKIYHEGADNEVQALKGINLKVYAGEIVAMMGESGSGKTTLLNCISGIDNPTRGEIYIDGQNIVTMRDNQKTDYRARKMGFIFQTFNLIPVLTAVENVELPLLVTGMKASEARKIATEMLESVSLGNRLNHKPSELSGGQRQRVTIARAIANSPAVIWADEPTGNLDSETAHEILELLTDLNKRLDTTIVMVTHSDDIAKYAGRVVRMDSGEIVK